MAPEGTTELDQEMLEHSPGRAVVEATLNGLLQRGLLSTGRGTFLFHTGAVEDDWWETTVVGRKLIGAQAIELLPERTEAQPGEVISFALVNNGPDQVSLPRGYRVEKSEGQRWVNVAGEDIAIPSAAVELPPGSSSNLSARVPDDLSRGRYRIAVVVEAPPYLWTHTFEFSIS